MITIIPKADTVKDGKNIHYWLYIRDKKTHSYLGRWRITIGGIVELIQLSDAAITDRVGTSGHITATAYPANNSADIFWYVSDNAGTASAPPVPSEMPLYKSMMSFLDNAEVFGTGAGRHNIYKLPDGRMKIPESASSAGSNAKYLANVSKGNANGQNGGNTLVYTLGSVAGKCYLTAFDDNSGVWVTVPVEISSEGGIELRSVSAVSATVPADGWNEASAQSGFVESNYTEVINHSQQYPDTLENGRYGDYTRSFYFPYDEESEIQIVYSGEIPISSMPTLTGMDGSELYTLTQSKSNAFNGYKIKVTPKWKAEKDAFDKSSLITEPPAIGQLGFYNYLGVGYTELSLDNVTAKLRIVIYK